MYYDCSQVALAFLKQSSLMDNRAQEPKHVCWNPGCHILAVLSWIWDLISLYLFLPL